ncbi:MAG: glycosyltransferase family 2 protein [Candidatus Bathyarchaeia archaeon]
MQQWRPSVSIVIPAYNEGKTIGDIISRITAVMEKLKVRHEILVVDDGSTDNTKKVALASNAIVIGDGSNHGKGHAMRKAFRQARGEIIVTIDADGEHKPEEIPKLIYPLYNGTDIVSGSRFLGDGENFTTKLNQIGNKLLNLSITMMTGKYITDSQTGFRAFKKTFLNHITLKSDGFEIETEITVKGLRNGFKLEEIPILCLRREEGKSRLRILFDGFKMFTIIFRYGIAPVTHDTYNPQTHEES